MNKISPHPSFPKRGIGEGKLPTRLHEDPVLFFNQSHIRYRRLDRTFPFLPLSPSFQPLGAERIDIAKRLSMRTIHSLVMLNLGLMEIRPD
jgi:hypothetical protein